MEVSFSIYLLVKYGTLTLPCLLVFGVLLPFKFKNWGYWKSSPLDRYGSSVNLRTLTSVKKFLCHTNINFCFKEFPIYILVNNTILIPVHLNLLPHQSLENKKDSNTLKIVIFSGRSDFNVYKCSVHDSPTGIYPFWFYRRHGQFMDTW